MAKNSTNTTEAMVLSVESLMAMGYSQADAEAMVGANKSGGGAGLPFPALKINYDPDLEFAKRGEWITDIQKDDKGNVKGVNNLGDKINIVIMASKYQYSKYDSVTMKSIVSSNIFDMADAKKAYDLSSGVSIAELKKDDVDNKIKFQEIMLVLVTSESHPEPKPYILYSKGAFMFSLNQLRKPLPNNGNVMYAMSFGLERQKNGSTTYYTVDPATFKATPRSMEEIKDGVKVFPQYIKAFTDWAESVSSGSSPKASTDSKQYDADDEDDVNFN